MTGYELRSITPLVPADPPTMTSIATPAALSHILGLAGRSVSLSELRDLTHSAISRHRSADEKLQCIREILSLRSSQNEQCGAVITEALSILIQQTKFGKVHTVPVRRPSASLIRPSLRRYVHPSAEALVGRSSRFERSRNIGVRARVNSILEGDVCPDLWW